MPAPDDTAARPRRDSTASLRQIPQAGRLLAAPAFAPLLAAHPRAAVVRALRATLDDLRTRGWAGELAPAEVEAGALAGAVAAALAREARPYYRRVINATGVVLHTNLGRAPLAPEALAALAATAGGGQRLEIDLATGERGGREEGVTALLRELTGCAAAAVVNNNAAATLLILAALARGKKVLISRGELVEIGGSYRLPEILEESGALLGEVGTTNRTRVDDYRRALDDSTGLILKVHTSNYRVLGFTAEATIDELVTLGRERGVPVAHDLGSGCLVDLAARGLPHTLMGEPNVRRSIAAGADVVCFSADKLLGGPQAGLILGRQDLVERCRRQPLFRALRPGRLTYAALEATLQLYRDGEDEAFRRVPALARLTATPADLRRRAQALARRLAGLPGLRARVRPCASQAGSGSLPLTELPSFGVALAWEGHSAETLAAALRQGDPAIVGRIDGGEVLLDLRTVGEGEVGEVVGRLREVVAP